MKPKVKPYSHRHHVLGWMCEGLKEGRYHRTYSDTWLGAVRRWYETEPGETF